MAYSFFFHDEMRSLDTEDYKALENTQKISVIWNEYLNKSLGVVLDWATKTSFKD